MPVSRAGVSPRVPATDDTSRIERLSMYRIREVDGSDEDFAEILADLHRLTFFNGAPIPAFDQGYWWFAYYGVEPIGFAGVIPSTHAHNAGYFCRVGVLRSHCGRGLQLRLMRAMESQ